MTSMEIFEKARESRNSERSLSCFLRDMEPYIRSVCSRFSASECFRPFADDIFVSAQTGMYRAIMNFDFTKHGFLQYAKKSMEIEIRSFLSNETRTVRLPRYVISAQKLISDYRRKNGTDDSDGEMKAAGISSAKTYLLVENARSFNSVTSLDIAVNEKGITMCSLVQGDMTVDDAFDKSETEAELEHSLESLSPSEKYIIVHSFGLGGEEKKKNSVMATELGVTVATVIARRRRALSALKTSLLPLMT